MGFTAAKNKHYTSQQEFADCMHTWNKNHALVEKMNKEHTGVKFADNYTSDMTDAEFAQMKGTYLYEDN